MYYSQVNYTSYSNKWMAQCWRCFVYFLTRRLNDGKIHLCIIICMWFVTQKKILIQYTFTPYRFFSPVYYDWSHSKIRSLQISLEYFSWSIKVLWSRFSFWSPVSPLPFLGLWGPSTRTIIDITANLTVCSLFSSFARSKYLSINSLLFIFTLQSAIMVKS